MTNGMIHRSFILKTTSCPKRAWPQLVNIQWNATVTVDDVNFCDGLECVYVKYKSRASTARELPD